MTKGDVIGEISSPPTLAKEFTAQVFVTNHPNVITIGYSPVFHIHTAQVSCRVTQIIKRLNNEVADNPDTIRNGDLALIKFSPLKPVVIETKDSIPNLAGFVIRDSGKTVAAGKCVEVVKKELKF